MNLHIKHIALTALLLVTVLGFFAWQAFEISQTQINAGYQKQVEILAGTLTNSLRAFMLEGRGKEVRKFLEPFVDEEIEAIRILKEDGFISASTIPGEAGSRKDNMPSQFSKNISMQALSLQTLNGEEIYLGFFAVKNEELCYKCHSSRKKINGILNIEISAREATEAINRTRAWIIGIYLFSLIILVVAFWLANMYFFKKPIDEIRYLLKKAEDGDFSAGISTNRKDEIGMIISNLNSLGLKLNKYKEETERCGKESLRQMERMASIGEVAEAVAHEIKNPLAGISGALQVIAEDIPDDNPRKEICNEILDEITRLDTAVKDLLFYARTPAPNLILADINAIIEKVGVSIRTLAEKFSVKINLISDNIPDVMIDPDQMEKALLSIAHNSISSMPEGGTMTIASCIKPQSNEVEVILSDTRKSMTEEEIKNVFKPKFSTKHLGTGLGLAISRNIIEAHKGRIELESSIDAGSIFRVILPQRN
ncbi:MAG: hypothetical protein A2X59_03555 [Nitrospirae bacterium GWC2_42_7]|nr:MAG: hypothetical protein A2X59_03555 [Nitrospirae bacterium GWC2_42_7]